MVLRYNTILQKTTIDFNKGIEVTPSSESLLDSRNNAWNVWVLFGTGFPAKL